MWEWVHGFIQNHTGLVSAVIWGVAIWVIAAALGDIFPKMWGKYCDYLEKPFTKVGKIIIWLIGTLAAGVALVSVVAGGVSESGARNLGLALLAVAVWLLWEIRHGIDVVLERLKDRA